MQVGRVSSSVLASWLQAAGGWRAAPRMLFPLIVSELLTLGSSWWLTRWAAAPDNLGRAANLKFLGGYSAWAALAAVLVVIRSRTILSLGLRAGSVMHDELLRTLTQAPLAFFDVTPIGRLLARFSRKLLFHVHAHALSTSTPLSTPSGTSISTLPCTPISMRASR